jgi:hypothetical protein
MTVSAFHPGLCMDIRKHFKKGGTLCHRSTLIPQTVLARRSAVKFHTGKIAVMAIKTSIRHGADEKISLSFMTVETISYMARFTVVFKKIRIILTQIFFHKGFLNGPGAH